MIILRQENFHAYDSSFWTGPGLGTPILYNFSSESGLTFRSDGVANRDQYGLISNNTFARTNLIMIFRCVGTDALVDSVVGYASGFINPLPVDGTFIRLFDQVNTGRLRILTRQASVTVQNNVTMAATTFVDAAQTVGTFWIAIKMEASGATVKYRIGDSGAWTQPATLPTGTTTDNLRVVIGFPANESDICYNGFILEQDTGVFTDAQLDAIIAASNINPALTSVVRPNIARGRTLDRGKANSLALRLYAGGVPRPGLTSSVLTLNLFKNGVLSTETFGTGFTLTEIGGAVAGLGYYRLDITEATLTVDGDYTIAIRATTDTSLYIDPVEIYCHVTPFYGLAMFERQLYPDGHEEVHKPGGGILVQHQVFDKDGALIAPTPGVPAKTTQFI